MARYKLLNGTRIECTAEEVAELDAMKRFVLYLSTGDFNAGTSTLYGRVA